MALIVASCGDDSETTDTDSAGATTAATAPAATSDPATSDPPSTVVAASTTGAPSTTAAPSTVPEDVPQRIVSLSPTHTEILFAVGADDQVVAVDSLSNFPEAAADVVTDLSAFEPNVEAIAGYEPDLVIVQSEGPIVEQLDTLGIETWIGVAPATMDDVYAQIEQLGAVTGHVGDAAELVGQMETDLNALTEDLPKLDRPLTYYHELDNTYFSVTSDTFIGSIYSMFGLENIADETSDQAGGYPQLNPEFIVTANPDMIFLADTVCCGETKKTVAARGGWKQISAVREGLVFEMNDDLASRWGPRIVDYAAQVRAAVDKAAALERAG
ncbi:MAG: ABC transporter substrate-binding protein [Actinomycetota bacterium]|nr:ABC transporter substrate-binding protein [Actinomycetota bacterium]